MQEKEKVSNIKSLFFNNFLKSSLTLNSIFAFSIAKRDGYRLGFSLNKINRGNDIPVTKIAINSMQFLKFFRPSAISSEDGFYDKLCTNKALTKLAIIVPIGEANVAIAIARAI